MRWRILTFDLFSPVIAVAALLVGINHMVPILDTKPAVRPAVVHARPIVYHEVNRALKGDKLTSNVLVPEKTRSKAPELDRTPMPAACEGAFSELMADGKRNFAIVCTADADSVSIAALLP